MWGGQKRESISKLYILSLKRGMGGVLPNNRLMGMCCWVGSHFRNWIGSNGVAFLIDVLEWGCTFQNFATAKNSGLKEFKNGKTDS